MKKTVLFFLVFGLLFSFLAACGESSDTEDTAAPVSAAQESGTADLSGTEASAEPAVSSGTTIPSESEQPSDTENSSEKAASNEPDQPSEPGSGDSGNAEDGEYTFLGTVDDVLDHEIMIEVTEGDIQNYGDNVLVSFPDEIELHMQTGDTVRITFDGIVMPSLPPRVSASAYEVLESGG